MVGDGVGVDGADDRPVLLRVHGAVRLSEANDIGGDGCLEETYSGCSRTRVGCDKLV